MSEGTLEFRLTPFDAPAAAQLVAEVQAEYVERYGGPDETPVGPDEFTPPCGAFLLVYERAGAESTPVACAGIRMVAPGVAEMKRMYVRAAARRRGIARRLLQRVEEEAVRLGATEVRLETGSRQPEAIALYESAGYLDTEPFGHYAGAPLARHLAKQVVSG